MARSQAEISRPACGGPVGAGTVSVPRGPELLTGCPLTYFSKCHRWKTGIGHSERTVTRENSKPVRFVAGQNKERGAMKGISGDQIRARSPAGQTATCPMALVNRGLDRVSVGRGGGFERGVSAWSTDLDRRRVHGVNYTLLVCKRPRWVLPLGSGGLVYVLSFMCFAPGSPVGGPRGGAHAAQLGVPFRSRARAANARDGL